MIMRTAVFLGGFLVGIAFSANAGNPDHCHGDCAVLYQQCIAAGNPESTCNNRQLRCLQLCCGNIVC